MRKLLRSLNVLEWEACGIGMFYMGVGSACIGLGVKWYGIMFLIIGLILEIPGFYLVFKHRSS